MSVLPGNTATQILGTNATPEQVQALTAELHLDEPMLERYWNWLSGVLSGNLGTSLVTRSSVSTILVQRLPVTLEVALVALVVALGVAIVVAVLAARRPNGIFDRLSMVVSLGGLSIAPYILALVLVLIFAVQLRILPAIGWVGPSSSISQNIRCIILPCASLGLPLACLYTRILRGDLVEQIDNEDYVMAAKARGVRPWQLLTGHVLRNSLFTLVTIAALNLGTLLGSTVIVEQIFSLPGLGQEIYQAIGNRDVPVVTGLVLIFAAAVVIANLIADVLYTALDPRIRHGRTSA